MCCGRSLVDGRLKVRQIEGGPHARATPPSTVTSATPNVVERRRVARLRAVFSLTRGVGPHASEKCRAKRRRSTTRLGSLRYARQRKCPPGLSSTN